jgi:translation elongation factor EF-4
MPISYQCEAINIQEAVKRARKALECGEIDKVFAELKKIEDAAINLNRNA